MKIKHIFLFMLVIVSLSIANRSYRKNKLYDDYVISKGNVLSYKSGKFREIQFSIDGINLEEDASMGIPFPSCGKNIAKNMADIKKVKFPVIYSNKDNMRHEILIYKNQYEKLGLSIPDSLKIIVNKLSNCFNQK